MRLDNPALFTIFVDGARGTAEPGDPSNPAGVFQPEFRQPLALGSFPTCKPDWTRPNGVMRILIMTGRVMYGWQTLITNPAS